MKNDRNILSSRIKELRTEKGYTQEELALKLGLKGKSSISNYESGNITPSDEIKLKMCAIFECTMDYLMGNSEYKNLLNIQELLHKSKNNIIDSDALEKYSKVLTETEKEMLHKMFTNFVKQINKNSSQPFFITNNNDSKELFNLPIFTKILSTSPILSDKYIEGYLPTSIKTYNLLEPNNYFYLHVSSKSMNKLVKEGSYILIKKQNFAKNGDIVLAIVNGTNEAIIRKYKKINDSLIILESQSDDLSFEPIYIDKNARFEVIGKAIGFSGIL